MEGRSGLLAHFDEAGEALDPGRAGGRFDLQAGASHGHVGDGDRSELGGHNRVHPELGAGDPGVEAQERTHEGEGRSGRPGLGEQAVG